MTAPLDIPALKAGLAKAKWAADWPHNIVPPGKPAHEIACAAIRALPLLIERIEAMEGALDEADFLCARLREFERDLADDDAGRQYCGHVTPSLARLEAVLANLPSNEKGQPND